MKEKTLAEKEVGGDNYKQDNGFYWSKDVKKAVEKLKKELKVVYQEDFIDKKIDKIFGEFK